MYIVYIYPPMYSIYHISPPIYLYINLALGHRIRV